MILSNYLNKYTWHHRLNENSWRLRKRKNYEELLLKIIHRDCQIIPNWFSSFEPYTIRQLYASLVCRKVCTRDKIGFEFQRVDIMHRERVVWLIVAKKSAWRAPANVSFCTCLNIIGLFKKLTGTLRRFHVSKWLMALCGTEGRKLMGSKSC